MEVRAQIERYRREHDEILRFLGVFEGVLTLAESKKVEDRRAGLAKLREMERKFVEIREHCAEEEQNLESPFQVYLDDSALETLHSEHDLLDELSLSFCSEVEVLTTPPPTQGLVGLGRQLAQKLYRHIAYEEGLLKQIGDGSEAEEKVYLRYTQPGE